MQSFIYFCALNIVIWKIWHAYVFSPFTLHKLQGNKLPFGWVESKKFPPIHQLVSSKSSKIKLMLLN